MDIRTVDNTINYRKLHFYYRDGLPVQLVLPHAVMQAKTHQELTSLALLGQGKYPGSDPEQGYGSIAYTSSASHMFNVSELFTCHWRNSCFIHYATGIYFEVG